MSKLLKFNNFYVVRMFVVTLMIFSVAVMIFGQAQTKAKLAEADALHDEGIKLIKQGTNESFQTASTKFDAAREIYLTLDENDKTVRTSLADFANTLNKIAETLRDEKLFKFAETYYQNVRTVYQKLNDRENEISVLHNIGFALDRQKKYESAAKFYLLALKGYQETKNRTLEAGILNDLGITYENLKDQKKRLENYLKAVEIYRELNNTAKIAALSRTMGNIYYDRQEYAAALKFYDEVLSIHRIAQDKKETADLLIDTGDCFSKLNDTEKAVGSFEEAFKLRRDAKNVEGETEALNRLGDVFAAKHKYEIANDYFLQVLIIAETTKNIELQTDALIKIGRNYILQNRYSEANQSLEKAFDLVKDSKDDDMKAAVFNNLGALAQMQDDYEKAAGYYRQVRDLDIKTKNQRGEGLMLLNLGNTSLYFNRFDEAVNLTEQGRKILLPFNNPGDEVSAVMQLGLIYQAQSNFDEAIRYYQQTLEIAQKNKDEDFEQRALINLGNVYGELGQYNQAIESNRKALALRQKNKDQYVESISLLNIGFYFFKKQNYKEAKSNLEQAIEISRAIKSTRAEGYAVHNLGLVYYKLKNYPEALKRYDQALKIYLEVKDRRPESFLYDSYGELYRDSGEYDKALEYLEKGVRLARETKYQEVEANALGNIMTLWQKRGSPRLAIFYGKQTVNVYQSIRNGNRNLNKSLQRSFVGSKETVYRQLSDLLIGEGRISEAEAVLDLLKEEEFFAYLRRADDVAAGLKGKISLSPAEKKAFEDYEKDADEITQTAAEFGVLEKKNNDLPPGKSLAAADQKQYDALKAKHDAAVIVFDKFLNDLKVRFGTNDNRVAVVESDTQGILRRLNEPHTVIISTIVGEDRLNLIVTTNDTQRAHTVEIKAADLNKLVSEFRDAVKNPAIDPRPLGRKLFNVLFPAALQKDLDGIKADTLVWSLDGTLRYVPMAALWDGKNYLAERYTNAVLTLASRDKINAQTPTDRTKWLALGVGVSKAASVKNDDGSTANFDALAAVPQELCSVVSDPKKKDFCAAFGGKQNGVISGLMLPDDEFTLANFENNVGKVPVVHIASHFSLNAGDESDSYLLLGGSAERRFSLISLKKTRLDKVELLTLSACNTAMTSGANSSGVEIEGFGALAQNQGAKTVLATLWSVADDSTRDLMTEFYRQLEDNPKIGKAEALRQSQIKLINGKFKPAQDAEKHRSDAVRFGASANDYPKFTKDENAPFAHPFYWSPFILSGNWQ